MSMLCVMDRQAGDTRVMWDPDNADEVEAARAAFDKLRGEKKFVAYKVAEPGDKGEVIREFDPQAGKIILAPPMVGG